MNTHALPVFVETALRQWEQIAFLAYDGYCRHGRGAVSLESAGNINLTKVTYLAFPPGCPSVDARTAQMVDAYDPSSELIVVFEESGPALRSIHVRTAPNARAPKRVWFFELLRLLQEAPESAPRDIPDQFWSMVEKLEDAKKEHGA